ncbi:MAG: cysteine desulfurase, partial [Muribaculaceae bacterium]|nr:cysteine desulfurase [Muribaculaceae bacterium]
YYTWNAKIINARNQIKWLIGAEYADGILEWNTAESAEGNNAISLSLQTDSTKEVKRVFGYAVTAPTDNDIVYIDSISLMRERVSRLNYQRRNKQQRVTPVPADSIIPEK